MVSLYNYFFNNISLIFNIITPATIIQIETIFKVLYGSLKYIMPITDTPIMPRPAHIAYAKLKSNFFNAKRKTVNPIAQKTNSFFLIHPFYNIFSTRDYLN